MKIRAGFVSNSSSSMFVVAFPYEPENVKDVLLMMFNSQQFLGNPYDSDKTETKKIAETVWQDIKPQKRWKYKTMVDRVGNAVNRGSVDGQPDYADYIAKVNHTTDLEYDGETLITARVREQIDWGAYNKACDAHSRVVVDELLKQFEGQKIYIFSYGDDDGDYYSVLEHGGIFDNLGHLRISCH